MFFGQKIQILSIICFLFSISTAFSQSDAVIENLPSVDSLVQMALKNSEKLKTHVVSIAILEQEAKIKKLDWTERISAYTNAAYGNSTTASLNSTVDDQNQINTLRTDLFANVGVTARFSLGDLVKRPHQRQLEKLRTEQAQAQQEMFRAEIRLKVTHLYDDLNMTIRSIETKADNVEAFRLSVEIAERYFKEGTMEVSSYTMILAQKIKAEEELEKTKALVRMQLHELQLVTGWER
jgi:outer membrane protein TolC